MNTKQLRKLGVPEECLTLGVQAVSRLAQAEPSRAARAKATILDILDKPDAFTADPFFGEFASALLSDVAPEPTVAIDYLTWGTEIDDAAHQQMRDACHLPSARSAALMPDAHVGYGLPIGGVLATVGTVIPYAVGVDIACRMKLSVLDASPTLLRTKPDRFRTALLSGTVFGVGAQLERRYHHDVLDQDWSVTRITRENKDKAAKQLGTSGSGNHFVEFGALTIDAFDADLGLEPGEYVALLSHSGSRGTGASVCSTYSAIAQSRIPAKYKHFGRLAWLDLASEAGQEYWQAMNLMGDYAAANHTVIHERVSNILGAQIIAGVENHHNFAWKELHGDEELIVHRKGATPAGKGVLGVIPGSMADPAFVVRGLGKAESIDSASHGAGRCMSRTAARAKFNWRATQKNLAERGITVLSAGADEVPGVYKDIRAVMAAQQDLVTPIARFDPLLVRMCDDGSRAED
jgi:tRNA-splicing ligase RtcB